MSNPMDYLIACAVPIVIVFVLYLIFTSDWFERFMYQVEYYPFDRGGLMSKLVPNKKTYVKRLKKMLTKRDKPCNCCPVRFRFKGNKLLKVPLAKCELCMTFIGLNGSRSINGCPCNQLGKEAITRALQAIEAYEAGTHKWCKEDL